MFLWNKEIDDIKNSGYMKIDVSITDALIEKFYNEILKDEEKLLLDLAFSKNPKQEDLDKLLNFWDIEVKGSTKSLLLAYLMKSNQNLKFTDYEEPRLKGLLNFWRFHNIKVIAHFSKIGKEFNRRGIIPLIIKGGAMKHLRPELPRVMGDIDILVEEKFFMDSAKIATQLGYEYSKIDIHAIDLHEKGKENGILDIHKFLYLETKKQKRWIKDLYSRAREELVFGVKCYVPAFEDLMFITLTNLAKNLRHKTTQAGILYSLFDCKYFLDQKPDFDWNIVRQNAKKTGVEVQINFAVKFIKKIAPEILPQTIFEEFLFEKETNDYSNLVMFNRFYLEDLRVQCRAMKIKNLFKDLDFFRSYCRLKPKYQALKLIRKNPSLIKIFIKDLNKV